jgi:hypothetical protein
VSMLILRIISIEKQNACADSRPIEPGRAAHGATARDQAAVEPGTPACALAAQGVAPGMGT